MSKKNTYLAVFLGSPKTSRWKKWNKMSKAEMKAKEEEGKAVWGQWMQKYHKDIVYVGGPLGSTKRASNKGIKNVTNDLAAFVVVRASSHAAAAKMFKDHPHFTIFPGEAVDVMPLIPIPGM